MKMNKDWIPRWVWSFSESVSHSVVSNPLQPSTITCPTPLSWNSLDKDIEVGSHTFSRGSFWPRDRPQVSCTTCRFVTAWSQAGKPQSEYVVQSLIRVWLFATLWTATHQASLSLSPASGVCPSSCPLNQRYQSEYSTKKRGDATYYIFLRSVSHLWGAL